MGEDIWKENMSFEDFFDMCRRVAERAERAADRIEALEDAGFMSHIRKLDREEATRRQILRNKVMSEIYDGP